MRQYCLNRDELSQIIDIELGKRKLYDDEDKMKVILYDWHNWDLELICSTLLLSYILEKRQKQSVNVLKLLQDIYNILGEKGLLVFEQLDEYFIKNMLQCTRHKALPIEDELVQIRSQLSEHNYNFK